MLKLMIVDDEYLFREALKISLPWQELGYEVCCEAENGADALENVAEFQPDVALVDINMPIMDGLEFAAEMKATGQNIIIIIITGYGEFTYAHQAIQLGIENYILKPVDEKELAQVLTSIKTLIEKESAARLEFEALKKQVRQYRPILKEMVLNDLLQGNKTRGKDDFLEFREYFSTDIYSSFFQVIVLELDKRKEYGWDAHDTHIWSFAVSNIAAEILSTAGYFDICRDIENKINIIFFQDAGEDKAQKSILNLCERIRISVLKYLKFTVSIGVGSSYNDIGNLSLSYREAIFSLKSKLSMGENKVFAFDNYKENQISTSLYTVEHRKQLLMDLRVGDVQSVTAIIKSIFEKARFPSCSSEMVMVVGVELISTCLEFVAETGYAVNTVLGSYFDILGFIQEKKSIEELEQCIGELFLKAYELVHGNKNRRSAKIVDEVKKYIYENYERFDLKIDDISNNIHINYGHLCFLFKRETGSTINDYITETRIKKAKELMDAGVTSVAAVSSRVGYADANYFGKCFKKLYGLTPGKYIENSSMPR